MTYAPPALRRTLPPAAIRRAIEQSRDLAGYMVWPVELEDEINEAADEVTGLCWAGQPGPTRRTRLACLLPMNHDGDCGWRRPLAMRTAVAS